MSILTMPSSNNLPQFSQSCLLFKFSNKQCDLGSWKRPMFAVNLEERYVIIVK